MSMTGATLLSVLIITLMPIVLAFLATEVDEHNVMENGDHIKKHLFHR